MQSPLVDIRLANQPFDCTTFVWEVLIAYGNESSLLMSQDITPTINLISHTWHSRRRNSNVFSYDAEIRTYHLPDDVQLHYMLNYSHGLIL